MFEVEEDTLADAEEHRLAGDAAHEMLTGDGGGRDAIAAATARLGDRAPYRAAAERLQTVLAELDDVARTVGDAADGIDADPERLAEVRARRQQLRDLCRKYGDDLADVQRFHAEATHRVAELEGYEERAAALDAARRAAFEAERKAAAVVGRHSTWGGAAVRRRRHVAAAGAGDAARRAVGRCRRRRPRGRRRVAPRGEPRLAAAAADACRVRRRARPHDAGASPRRRGRHTDRPRRRLDRGVRRGRRRHRRRRGGGRRPRPWPRWPSGHQVLVVTHLAQVAAAGRPPGHGVEAVAGGHTHTAARPIDGRGPRRRAGPHAVGRRRRRGGSPARRPAARRGDPGPTPAARGRLGSRPAGNPGNPHQRDGGPDGEAHLRDGWRGQLARQGPHGVVARAACSSCAACG